MAKTTGLDTRLYVEGYDLSGDANSLGSAGWSQNLLDVTTLDSSAIKRIVGEASGQMTVNVWFDAASNKSHSVFTSLSGKQPTADQTVLVPMGSAVGAKSAGIVAKQADYSVDSAPGSAISGVVNYSSTGGAPLEFGEMLTAHDDTHSSAGSGTVVDSGASSSNGASAYLQLLSLDSGSVTVNLQESTSSGGSYANFMTFSTVAAAGAPTAVRQTMEGTVQRYIKVVTTGTFSNAKIAVALCRL